jgi:hypothetical protein
MSVRINSSANDFPLSRVLSLATAMTAILLVAALGELPKPEAAIFADTGWEPAAVYAHLDRIDREIAGPAGIPIHRVSAGNIRADALDPAPRFASMPLFVKNRAGGDGMARRQCTREYKLKPIKAQLRDLLGYPHSLPVPKGVLVELWIGISVDEIRRAKDSDVKYGRNVFPLLDLNMNRAACERVLRRHGYGDTVKSACIGCPFQGNAQWRNLRDHSPAEWADAVAFDAAIRNGSARADAEGQPLRGEMYLHRSRLPLSLAPIDRVTFAEHKAAPGDIFEAIADAEDEMRGCGPFSCRSADEDIPTVGDPA